MQDELLQIKHSIKPLMKKALEGDNSAVDQILKLSRRREELLLSHRYVKHIHQPSDKMRSGIPYRYVAFGFIIGLLVSLFINLIT